MKSLNWKDEKRRGRSTSFVHNNLFPWKPSKGGRVCLVNLAQARKKAPNDLNSLQKDEELAKISTKDFSRDLFQINGISIKIVSKEIRMQRQLGGLPKRSHPWKSDCISSFSYCSWEIIGSGPFLKRSFDHSYKTNARPGSQVRRVNPSRIFFKKRDQNNDVFNQKRFFQKKIIKLRVGFTRDNRVMVRLGFLTRPSRVTRSIFSSVQINPSPGSARSQIWTFRKSSYLQVCSNLDIILFPWWYHKRSYSLDVTVEENPGFANQLKSPEN